MANTPRTTRTLSVASKVGTQIYTGDAYVGYGVLTNGTAETVSAKFYDKTTSVVPASDLPVVTVAVPKESTLPIDLDLPFTKGLRLAAFKKAVDTNEEEVAAAALLVTLTTT